MPSRYLVRLLGTASVTVLIVALQGRVVAQQPQLGVNDLAYLWPVPTNKAEVDSLISAEELITGGRVWSEADFQRVIQQAQSITVPSSAPGRDFQISFAQMAQDFSKASTWKVVGFRVDPSAPGASVETISRFGSTPQIRLVLQPVTIQNNQPEAHDYAAHLAFSYTTVDLTPTSRAVPDRQAFQLIVNDLLSLRAQCRQSGADTSGPFRVHPCLQSRAPSFLSAVRAFLKQRLSPEKLKDIAFMGIRPPEPWIFFAMKRGDDGTFVQRSSPIIGGQNAQMFFMLDPKKVLPAPSTLNVPPLGGVSTATLFQGDAGTTLDTQVFPNAESPKRRDIADVIANPRRSNVLNTDCVSCHTESRRRISLRLADAGEGFRFTRPEGVSGSDESLLPKEDWNLRNFGWFKGAATITTRTANEAAEAVELVNREYLAARPEATPVAAAAVSAGSHGLTLVMTTKSQSDTAALRALVEKLQSLPDNQNPISTALTRLGLVHFARFVFIGERQFAVITTYDGAFEDYVDAFINAVGNVFDAMLAHISDAPPLPVSSHRAEFLAFVKKHDVPSVGPLYSAYPTLTVLDILSAQPAISK